MNEKAFLEQFKNKFSSIEQKLLDMAELAALNSSVKLYLVGGPVRDLLLGKLNHDLDFLIEGEIDLFIQEFNKITNSEPINSSQFKTFKYNLYENEIDIALARTEIYPHPGSLPKITPSTIHEDLYRRDFTINALAIKLFPKPYKIIDPLNGFDELKNKSIKIIHDKSFQDDPTRIFRTLRYTSRLDFAIDKTTHKAIKRDMQHIKDISGQRIKNELFKFLSEPNIYKSLSYLSVYNVLKVININFPSNITFVQYLKKFKHINDLMIDKEIILLGILCFNMDKSKLEDFISEFSIPRKMCNVLFDLIKVKKKIYYSTRLKKASSITQLFDKYQVVALQIAATISNNQNFNNIVDKYIGHWSKVKLDYDGDQISQLLSIDKRKLSGIISKVRNAKIDGIVHGKSNEKEFILKLNKQLFK